MTASEIKTTDIGAWAWPASWGQQPSDEHVRLSLHIAEPRSREWEAEQEAAMDAAYAQEAERDRQAANDDASFRAYCREMGANS